MTIGDILAVIAAIAALAATWIATILLAALAFPARTTLARARLIEAPGGTLLRGLAITLGVAILAAVLNSSHAGPARLLAGALLCGLTAVSAIGGAGIARLVAERLLAHGTQMCGFAALTRATILYVGAGFLPVVGWFLFAPLGLLYSVGAASAALWPRTSRAPVALPSAPEPAP